MNSPGTSWDGVRALVLGAGGFIGRWVSRELSLAGAELIMAARGNPGAGELRADRSLRGSVVVADADQEGAIETLLARSAPHVVFNLAGYGVDQSERDAPTALRINAELPARLAETFEPAPGWRGQHIVHAGSALEYGVAGGDLREDETVPLPGTLYGRTKLEGTTRLLAAGARRGLRVAIARLFMVYGPGEHAGRLMPTLLAATHSQSRIPLSSGTQRRDFSAVADVAEGLRRIAEVRDTSVGIVNLASSRLTPVREFVEVAAVTLGIARERLDFGALPSRPEEQSHDAVNIEKLRRLTAWAPATSIAEGVAAAARADRPQPPR